jgi:sulfate adenylyltransferase subunit 1 (EFTu-like GTPase family)
VIPGMKNAPTPRTFRRIRTDYLRFAANLRLDRKHRVPLFARAL